MNNYIASTSTIVGVFLFSSGHNARGTIHTMSHEFKIHDNLIEGSELLNHYPRILAQLLNNRGVQTTKEAKNLLNPRWEDNSNPMLMKGVPEAVEFIQKSIQNNEKITIYADYDADGIPGAVILSSFLEKIGYTNYDVYIPHRHTEGYGLHISALEKIQSSGTSLVITIDVGITANEAAGWCKENDLPLIITDHHEPLLRTDGTQNLPEADILINPKQSMCSYPDKMLCGCAVIFKLIQAFLTTHGEEYNVPKEWEKWLLDMVGIATLSDMVPLVDENRIFAYYGMKVIQKTKRKGLKKLIFDAGLTPTYLTEEDIVFSITPKINAASRMSHPEDAFFALRATTEEETETAVSELISLNNERKKLVDSTMKDILTELGEQPHPPVIVVGSPNWQAGILGLLASKISEEFKCPSFVWSEEGEVVKGSCRSYGGVNLVELMSSAEEGSFIQFGGHAGAGGFSCNKEEISFLQKRLERAHTKYLDSGNHIEEEPLLVDAEIALDEVTFDTYRTLRKLAPFGQGNPKPSFLFKNLEIDSVEMFGKKKNHLKLWFRTTTGRKISGIKFFSTLESFTKQLKKGVHIDLVAHIDYSVFRGKKELRLGVIHIR